MPMIIAGVVKQLAFSYLGNSKIMEKTLVILMKYLASKSTNTVDDKLVALLEQSIAQKEKV